LSPEIYTIGAGARWKINKNIDGAFYWGRRMKEIVPLRKDDLENNKIHFQVTVSIF